jgi:putative acetyltransferase
VRIRVPFVIALGHPDCYPRFGFGPASQYRLACQWPGGPDEAFMVLVFDESAVKGVVGIVCCRTEFDETM